jgi:hypothetical protein
MAGIACSEYLKRNGRARARRSWVDAARRLGLWRHGEEPRLSGWLDDRFVIAECESGALTRVASLLWPPLDLGLFVHSRPVLRRGGTIGASLDASAEDRDRAEVLLDDPLLDAIERLPCEVTVSDAQVQLRAFGLVPAEELERMLRSANEIAVLIDQRVSVRPSPAQATAPA